MSDDWHEEPTQHRANPDTTGAQDPWYEREYGARSSAGAHEHGQNSPYGTWPTGSSTQVPMTQTSPPVRQPRWLVPFVAVMCLVTGFALVTLLLQRGQSPKASPAPSQVTQTASSTPSPSSPTSSSASSSSSLTASSTTTTVTSTATGSSSTSDAVSSEPAQFPNSTSTSCLLDDGGRGTVSDPDVRQSKSTNSSCAFLPNVKDAVWGHVRSNPGDSSYALGVFSSYRKAHVPGSDGTVDLRCKTQASFVKCVSDDPKVEIWVREPVS